MKNTISYLILYVSIDFIESTGLQNGAIIGRREKNILPAWGLFVVWDFVCF